MAVQSLRFSNGVHWVWDDSIGVGELISTPNDGYHILTNIEYLPRPNHDFEGMPDHWRITIEEQSDPTYDYCPTYTYTKVLKGDGTKSKRLIGTALAKDCRRLTKIGLTEEYEAKVAELAWKYGEIVKFCTQ
jgi:hypothetical protein